MLEIYYIIEILMFYKLPNANVYIRILYIIFPSHCHYIYIGIYKS